MQLESSFVSRMGKSTDWDCLFVHRKQGLYSSENEDDIKMDGRRESESQWNKWRKLVDPGEPTIIS